MEELDLLKKSWQKSEQSFEQVSENQIYTMIHKNSSSVVKWIMIIGIIEFVLVTALGIFIPDDNYDRTLEKNHVGTLVTVITIISYFVSIAFIYLFYKNFRTISTTDSVRKLMRNILKTRKTVQFYVWYNLGMFVIMFIIIMFSFCYYDENFSKMFDKVQLKENASLIWAGIIGLFFIMFSVMFGLFWLFYKLVYGFLLRKLNKNYQELKKIDL